MASMADNTQLLALRRGKVSKQLSKNHVPDEVAALGSCVESLCINLTKAFKERASSAISVVGPVKCGKSLAVKFALRKLREEKAVFKEVYLDMSLVSISGLLREILTQVRPDLDSSKIGKGKSQLAKLKSYLKSDDVLVFVLKDVDKFTDLLDILTNIILSKFCQIILIGVTKIIDFKFKLDIPMKSIMCPSYTLPDIQTILSSVLRIKMINDGGVGTESKSEATTSYTIKAHNENVDRLVESKEFFDMIQVNVITRSIQWFLQLMYVMNSTITEQSPFYSVESLAVALVKMHADDARLALAWCGPYELALLISLQHLVTKHIDRLNFEQAYAAFVKFATTQQMAYVNRAHAIQIFEKLGYYQLINWGSKGMKPTLVDRYHQQVFLNIRNTEIKNFINAVKGKQPSWLLIWHQSPDLT